VISSTDIIGNIGEPERETEYEHNNINEKPEGVKFSPPAVEELI